jgi:predicted aspartyl protease
VRIYGTDYKDRLVDTGFNVEMVPFLQEIDPEVKERFGLPSEEDICVCTKSQVPTMVERAVKLL